MSPSMFFWYLPCAPGVRQVSIDAVSGALDAWKRSKLPTSIQLVTSSFLLLLAMASNLLAMASTYLIAS